MKYFRKLSAILIACLTGLPSMNATEGIEISHLGTNNTLVRVTGDARYLLLPIEEKVDDAAIRVLLDGRQETILYARLARNKVDYYVPFDLERYKDKNIVLDVITAQDRTSVRDASDDACWRKMQLSDTFDVANVEKFRPLFHHAPLYGWMNDPNGMYYRDGVWHLYFQYNPYGSKWQNMTWAHSSSKDLINWEHHPLAIEPNGLGTVFSGSCVIDTANTAGFGADEVIALYTSAGVNQIQSLAHSSDDGQTFEVYPGNPVLTLDSEARDPNMFWNNETGEWNLLLAHALDHEMLFFTSPDLKTWTLQSAFGKGLGAQDGVWECPDLLRLPVEGSDEYKWVLICNLNPGGVFGGSATQYFTGDFDGKKFTVDTLADGTVPVKWMDYGKDHYATVSWHNAPDNRHVVIGWMSNWQYAAEVPTMQFRSANTLPRDLSLTRDKDGQYRLKTVPSPETDALRGRRIQNVKSQTVGSAGKKYNLPTDNDGICEIVLTLEARSAETMKLSLSNKLGEHVDMIFNPEAQTFSFDRTNSGITDFNQDFPAVVWAPTMHDNGEQKLRVFIDRSSIEIFDGEGSFVMTNLVFPNEPYSTLTVSAEGGKGQVKHLEIFTINLNK